MNTNYSMALYNAIIKSLKSEFTKKVLKKACLKRHLFAFYGTKKESRLLYFDAEEKSIASQRIIFHHDNDICSGY